VVLECPQTRAQHCLDSRAEQQAVRQVGDVLARQPEVDPLAADTVGQAVPEKVLDGLHVVICRRPALVTLGFELFYDTGVGRVELAVAASQRLAVGHRQFDRRRIEPRQRDEILHLDLQAGPHQRLLTGVRPQRFGDTGVPPVQR
jgi:hypothetical protein